MTYHSELETRLPVTSSQFQPALPLNCEILRVNSSFPSRVEPTSSRENFIALHAVITSSGYYNFMNEQINIPSQLNPDIWDQQLVDYWDKQLPLLIKFGFPLDFDRNGVLVSHHDNHSSVKLFLEDLDAYLEEEIKHKAVLGPFDEPPIKTREKPNSAHRRVIIDLSFPHGMSVNSGVMPRSHCGEATTN